MLIDVLYGSDRAVLAWSLSLIGTTFVVLYKRAIKALIQRFDRA